MKKVRYGRLTITALLLIYSLWIIFATPSQKETPYERRVRLLQTELSELAETSPERATLEQDLAQAIIDAEAHSAPKLKEKAARIEAEMAGLDADSADYASRKAELANIRNMIPKWYDAFGLNLGLDLRGGTEVRMQIISEEAERKARVLREEYEAFKDELDATLPDSEGYQQKEEELERKRMDLAGAERDVQSNIKEAVNVIRNRLDGRGMAGIPVAQEGGNRIRVQLPGMDSNIAQRVIKTIKQAGHLEFRVVVNLEKDKLTAKDLDAAMPNLTPNSYNICLNPGHQRVLTPGEIDANGLCKEHGDKLYDWLEEPANYDRHGEITRGAQMHLLEQDPEALTGKHITVARAEMDPKNPGFFQVSVEFDREGTRRFGQLTSANVGEQLSIILDRKLRSAPVIQVAITSGQCVITGNFSQTEAVDLSNVLKEGSLPVELEVQMQNDVGATLGEDSIASGMTAIAVGLSMVLVFMAIYYLMAGLVTVGGLLLNMVFILAIFIGIGAVLTLPGIAGLILTVGMAVDANVLIFERIREERQKGVGLARAIENGYDRAFVTIVDANLTTFITALILWTFGTEAVKGFAMTLTIGIITSMFVALFVTRAVFHLLLDLKIIKKLRMMQAIKAHNINFVRLCKPVGIISMILIICGMVLFFKRGDDNYGNDFLGGILAQPNLTEEISLATVRGQMDEIKAGVCSRMQAILRDELGDPDLTLPVEDFGEIALQGFGVPNEKGYNSLVLRTKPVSFKDEAIKEKVSAEKAAEAFSTAFRETIREVLPVYSDGVTEIARLEDTIDGRAMWEFNLNLAHPRSPQELQNFLASTELKNVYVRLPGAPRPNYQASNATAIVAIPKTDADGKELKTPTEIKDAIVALVEDLSGGFIDSESGIGKVSLVGGEAPEGQLLVSVAVTLNQPMTADKLKAALLLSDSIRQVEVTMTNLPELAEPPVEPVRQIMVSCSVAPLNMPWETATPMAEEQYIREQLSALRSAGSLDYTESFSRFTSVGPLVAGEMKQKAILALLYSMVAIFLYIWLRFQFRAAFGIGACLALAHDVLFTIGAIAVADQYLGMNIKIDLTIVAALLTIVGYSLNDTIVVFDRIRENIAAGGASLTETINHSINQTLSRTFLTSMTTLLVVVALLVLGGEVIHGFAFSLLIGIIAGTLSSIFIAAPVLVYMDNYNRKRNEKS